MLLILAKEVFFKKKKEVWEGFPKLPAAEEKAIVFLDTFGHIICH